MSVYSISTTRSIKISSWLAALSPRLSISSSHSCRPLNFPSKALLHTGADTSKLLTVAKAKAEAFDLAVKESSDPDAGYDDQIRLAKTMKDLAPIAEKWRAYQDMQKHLMEITDHMDETDPDVRELFIAEHETLNEQIRDLVTNEILAALLPVPPSATLPVVMSLNAGVGGSEAALCVTTMSRMYQRYAESKGWRVRVISQVDGTMEDGERGIREITFKIEAVDDKEQEVFGMLQWEKGVHRIQRVPVTEALGRIQTSTITVIVMPVYPDSEDSPLLEAKDVKVEVMRAGGAGGQHVNKTESAVRLTHIPSGITVSMQDTRSQHQNKALAWEILKARLSERKRQEEVEARRDSRRSQIKNAYRSERIRSYHFQHDRVTDHRIGQLFSNVEAIAAGPGLEVVIQALRQDFAQRRLDSLLEGEEDLDE